LDTEPQEARQTAIVPFERHLDLDFPQRHQEDFPDGGIQLQPAGGFIEKEVARILHAHYRNSLSKSVLSGPRIEDASVESTAISPRRSVHGDQVTAISPRRSGHSDQVTAISPRRSGHSDRVSAIGPRRSGLGSTTQASTPGSKIADEGSFIHEIKNVVSIVLKATTEAVTTQACEGQGDRTRTP
jgi:hypothetical protein